MTRLVGVLLLGSALFGCAPPLNTVPVALMTRDEGQFLAGIQQLLQSGDLRDQHAVESIVGAPLAFARTQPTLFGQARFFRPAPASAAGEAGVVWETIQLEAPPPRPTRIASLEVRALERLVCVDERTVQRQLAALPIDDSNRSLTVYSAQDGESYARFTKGSSERCFAGVTLVQNSNRS